MTFRPVLYWPFAVLSALIALVSFRVLILPLGEAMPHMAHYLSSVPAPMWVHVVFAPLALLLAPLQAWTGLRDRHRLLHRASGHAYGLSVLVAGAGSLAMLAQFQGSAWAATGFALLALLWIACTLTGIIHAMRGNTRLHRTWMLRSIALTFAAVTLRLYMAPLIAGGWSVAETYDITAWACWLPNLIVVELWLRRGRMRLA